MAEPESPQLQEIDPFVQWVFYTHITFRGKGLTYVVWPGFSGQMEEAKKAAVFIRDELNEKPGSSGGRMNGIDTSLLGFERPVAVIVQNPKEKRFARRISQPGEFETEESAVRTAFFKYLMFRSSER